LQLGLSQRALGPVARNREFFLARLRKGFTSPALAGQAVMGTGTTVEPYRRLSPHGLQRQMPDIEVSDGKIAPREGGGGAQEDQITMAAFGGAIVRASRLTISLWSSRPIDALRADEYGPRHSWSA